MATIPVLDAKALFAGEPSEIARLRMAARRHGFFYLDNHGVDEGLIAEVFAQSAAFFAQDDAAKQAVNMKRVAHRLGYEPLQSQQLEADTPPDLKEGFYVGPDFGDDPRAYDATRFGVGPNQWPTDLPVFRDVMNRYFDAATALAIKIMTALALSLDLPHDWFAEFTTDAARRLRLLHYPPQPAQPLPGEKGCGAHTDFGSITLLLQDKAGGLQVQDMASGQWMDAPPRPGSYVVNLGDLIERWTNRKYRSNPHRVINLSGQERYSVPFFFTGNPGYVVECIPTCCDSDEPPLYPPVTTVEHLRASYLRTYGD